MNRRKNLLGRRRARCGTPPRARTHCRRTWPDPRSAQSASQAAQESAAWLIHVAPETLKRLKRLGLEQDRTLQALGLEALDTLLEKYENPQ